MLNKILEKISGEKLFLATVFLLYLMVMIVGGINLIKSSLWQFVHILIQTIPILLLVFLFIFLSNLFLDTGKISRLVGKSAGIKGWVVSIMAGILSSGPIYMWYPLLADLKEKGMQDKFIVAFLYNRAVKIPMLPMMILFFGLPFILILLGYMVLFSIINGVLVDKLLKLK